VRTAAMLKARSVISVVASAVAGFFDPNEGAYRKRTVLNDGTENVQSVVEEAVSDTAAEARIRRFDANMKGAIEALLSEENASRVATLVLDSLRENEITPEELLATTEAPDLVVMIGAMLRANAPSFAPFLKQAVEKMKHPLVVSPAGPLGATAAQA
jgi:hypothetical protein